MELVRFALVLGVIFGGFATFDAFKQDKVVKAIVGFLMIAVAVAALVSVPALRLTS